MLNINKGLSLTELLLSLLFGSLLSLMLFNVYLQSSTHALNSLKYMRLRNDLQSLMWVMEYDIRRAGYGGDNYQVGDLKNKSIDINDAKNCIVFYYNHDQSLSLQSRHKMGFLFDPNTFQIFVASNVLPRASQCSSNRWRALSDVHFIKITALVFTEQVIIKNHKTTHYVHIKLQGELTGDPRYIYTLKTTLRLRNISSAETLSLQN
ncbi:putative type IV pilus assembly protein PilW [Psychromonas sp. CNPT3]|uniref:pilus assembly protein PilW n=1 Tax=Psychromonas sp. CNPT3 TaxID=314282 RepID=UPI00006E711D|nr:pilus assembly protein PilW [Psychromonas sp. CNPT3]AGH81936.1 putative type IV pilus assembly protein PilW [Psychromonas sp. CNPT3]